MMTDLCPNCGQLMSAMTNKGPTRNLTIEQQAKEIKRLRAALGDVGGYTAEPLLLQDEEAMCDRLDKIWKVVEKALRNE